jgi:hypothetical protein
MHTEVVHDQVGQLNEHEQGFSLNNASSVVAVAAQRLASERLEWRVDRR